MGNLPTTSRFGKARLSNSNTTLNFRNDVVPSRKDCLQLRNTALNVWLCKSTGSVFEMCLFFKYWVAGIPPVLVGYITKEYAVSFYSCSVHLQTRYCRDCSIYLQSGEPGSGRVDSYRKATLTTDKRDQANRLGASLATASIPGIAPTDNRCLLSAEELGSASVTARAPPLWQENSKLCGCARFLFADCLIRRIATHNAARLLCGPKDNTSLLARLNQSGGDKKQSCLCDV